MFGISLILLLKYASCSRRFIRITPDLMLVINLSQIQSIYKVVDKVFLVVTLTSELKPKQENPSVKSIPAEL